MTVPAGHGLKWCHDETFIEQTWSFYHVSGTKEEKNMFEANYVYIYIQIIYTRHHKYCIVYLQIIKIQQAGEETWKLPKSMIYHYCYLNVQVSLGLIWWTYMLNFASIPPMTCLLGAIIPGKIFGQKHNLSNHIPKLQLANICSTMLHLNLQLFFLAGESTSPQQTSFDTHDSWLHHHPRPKKLMMRPGWVFSSSPTWNFVSS